MPRSGGEFSVGANSIFLKVGNSVVAAYQLCEKTRGEFQQSELTAEQTREHG
jgi:hypothetical protein